MQPRLAPVPLSQMIEDINLVTWGLGNDYYRVGEVTSLFEDLDGGSGCGCGPR